MLNKVRQRIRNRAALLDYHRVATLRPARAMATFTFDDFPRSAYETGGKIIEATGARATYFITGSYMGRTVNGVDQYNASMLKSVHAAGHEIGCHTFDHSGLGKTGVDFALESCDRNLRFFQQTLGTAETMSSFAYPYGDTSRAVKGALARRFPLCRGVHEKLNSDWVDLAQIGIISLEMRHAGQLNLKNLVAKALARKGWIVFLSHDVSENPSPYGSTPALIEEALYHLDAAGIPVLTMKDAAARIDNIPYG